jgi:hypothetical protein
MRPETGKRTEEVIDEKTFHGDMMRINQETGKER